MTNQHGYILHVLQLYLVHGNTIRFFEIKMTRKKMYFIQFLLFYRFVHQHISDLMVEGPNTDCK